MKLLTTAAAFEILGPEHKFKTTASISEPIDKNGVLKGNLHLHIGHDFTWSTKFYPTADTPLKFIAHKLQKAGLKKIDGKLIVSGYLVYGGMATATLNTKAHLNKAASRFLTLLKEQKITGAKLSIQQNAHPNPSEITIATWLSPTLAEACVPINRQSHNEYADLLLMAIGYHDTKKSSFQAGAQAIRKWLKKINLNYKNLNIEDGSGLSHDNLLTANFLNDLIAYMLTSPNAATWAATLAISGFDGTYTSRLLSPNTTGRVLVKSGTLRDVIASSGILVNKHDTHTYIFSIIVNDMRMKKSTRIATDKIIQQIAQNHYNIKKPDKPELLSLKFENKIPTLRWKPNTHTPHKYRVYLSKNPQSWANAQSFDTTDNYLNLQDLDQAYLRVTAIDNQGFESLPSNIFALKKGKDPITIVEDCDCAWESKARPQNHFFNEDRAIADALPDDLPYETIHPSQLGTNHKLVLWNTGLCNATDLKNKELISKLWNSNTPLILNAFDFHTLNTEGQNCDPENQNFVNCFEKPIATTDLRFDNLSENHRLRRQCGYNGSRPSKLTLWKNAKPAFTLSNQHEPAAVCQPDKKNAIIAASLQAFDSKQSQQIAWQKIQHCLNSN